MIYFYFEFFIKLFSYFFSIIIFRIYTTIYLSATHAAHGAPCAVAMQSTIPAAPGRLKHSLQCTPEGVLSCAKAGLTLTVHAQCMPRACQRGVP